VSGDKLTTFLDFLIEKFDIKTGPYKSSGDCDLIAGTLKLILAPQPI